MAVFPGPSATAQTHGKTARFFLGLVVIARAKHPIPSRTRPLSAVAPMVLRLKTWESRSPPVLEKSEVSKCDDHKRQMAPEWEPFAFLGPLLVLRAVTRYDVTCLKP